MPTNNYQRHYYRHFKGGLYMILEECKHSETQEEMIVYKNLRDTQIWVRPKSMFFENVEPGKPRFKEITFDEVAKELSKGYENL